MSFKYMRKSNRPKPEPGNTPFNTEFQFDLLLSILMKFNRRVLRLSLMLFASICPEAEYAHMSRIKTVYFGLRSVMVWGCILYDCKLNLLTVPANLNGGIYQYTILDAVPH